MFHEKAIGMLKRGVAGNDEAEGPGGSKMSRKGAQLCPGGSAGWASMSRKIPVQSDIGKPSVLFI